MRLLVVGGDAAGMTAASHVHRHAPDVGVVVVERGAHTSYSMCGIPYYLGGLVERADDLVVRSPDDLRAAGIDVRTRTEAVDVDHSAARVRLRDLVGGAEGWEPYDALLLATGATPALPDVPGLAAHAAPLRTLDDAQGLRARLDRSDAPVRRAVVVGAGYIGIEVAEALVRRGIGAVLVDRSPLPMATLDDDMVGPLCEALERFGVEVHLGEDVIGVRKAGGAYEVTTAERTVVADLVLLAAGSEPASELAVAAGCRIGSSGGVVVDERMRTTVAGVWAAGDVVESRHLVDGSRVNVQLGTHANKQGKVAGVDLVAVLAGDGEGDAAFPGVVGTAVTKLCDLEVGRTGLTEREATEAGIAHAVVRFEGSAQAGYLPDAGTVHVKMLAERGTGRVLGCQLVGTGNVGKRIDVAATWCQLGVRVQDAQLLDLAYAPPFGGVWDLLQVAARKLARELELSPAL